MMKFTAMALIPDFGITMLSLSIDTTPLISAVGIGVVLVIVTAFSWYFYRGLGQEMVQAGVQLARTGRSSSCPPHGRPGTGKTFNILSS